MALFFDQSWFDERLAKANLAKKDVARALSITEQELADMWKDQREISVSEIKTLALLLAEPEAEVKKRGGLQGTSGAGAQVGRQSPRARAPAEAAKNERLDRIEAVLQEILAELKKRY